uniref:InlB B-repeat-containing protein n=1 Tax=Enterocloster aldenensis TaxID=358742 RepID=UPI0022E8F08A
MPKQYEADISNVSYVPPRPAGIPDSYEFTGWYDNELGEGDEYSFSGKIMPAMDITLYAKWSAPQFKVTFDVNGGVGEYPNQIVDYGKTVLQPDDNPTRDGYTFAGWMNDGSIFNFNTEIYDNTNLVAKWMSTHKLTVIYDAGEGVGVVPTDINQYVDGSSAAAKPGNTLTHPENKGFIGWKLGNSVYYPGETFIVDSSLAVNDEVKLVAQWDTLPAKTFLTYHSNFDNDETKTTDNIINNGSVTIIDGNELFERDGYVFEKWTTNRNGTGDVYNAGDTALLDNVGSNDLYAQWSMCKEITIEAASQEFVYDGLPHSDSTVSVKRGSLVQGDLLEATATGSVTNVSDTKNGNNPIAPGYRIMRGDVDVTRRYKITENPGTLTIKPKEVRITVAANSKMYGETDPSFADAVISEYVGSELSGIDLSVSRSDAGDDGLGTHEGVLNIGKTAAELDAEYTNYRFTVVAADFTITQNESGLSVDAADVIKTYDGNSYGVEPLSVPSGATITYKDAEGNYTLTESPVRRDVGTTKVEFKASLYGYGDAYGSADVTITAKAISIGIKSASKVYGEADPSFEKASISQYIGDDLDGISLEVIRSDAGNDELGIHEDVLVIGKTVKELDETYTNYRFAIYPGDFTIKSNDSLSVSASDVKKVYDGNGYGVEPVSVPSGATITYRDADGKYTLTESPTRTNVGTTKVEFKASLYGYDAAYGSADVTITAKEVSITAAEGSADVTITAKEVSITAADAGKVYGEADPSFADAVISEYVGSELSGIDLSVSRSDAGDDGLGTHEGVLNIGKTAAELDAEYTNYRFTVVAADFTITQNESGLSVDAAD